MCREDIVSWTRLNISSHIQYKYCRIHELKYILKQSGCVQFTAPLIKIQCVDANDLMHPTVCDESSVPGKGWVKYMHM